MSVRRFMCVRKRLDLAANTKPGGVCWIQFATASGLAKR
jgi:hypothetical protein